MSAVIRDIEDTLGYLDEVNLALQDGFIDKYEWATRTDHLKLHIEEIMVGVNIAMENK